MQNSLETGNMDTLLGEDKSRFELHIVGQCSK